MSKIVTSWIIGWKLAIAYCAEDLKTIRFVPIHQDGIVRSYGVDADAECQQYGGHVPPADGCRCGFNAWHDRSVNGWYQSTSDLRIAQDTSRNGSIVELRVGLYGTVVEGMLWRKEIGDTWGYQASRQRVADAFFTPECYLCGSRAVQVGLVKKYPAFGWSLHPVCQDHVHSQATVTLESLAQANPPIGVHWKTSE